MPTLCETFKALALQTHEWLADARTVDHQLLEETITDLLLLELKLRCPAEIECQTFTKPQESKVGADWEWWLLDDAGKRAIGFRMQAKVLNLRADSFAHLYYRPKSYKPYQSTTLKRAAAAKGMVPLYCLYSHPPLASWPVPPHGAAPEPYGCSLLGVNDLEKLRRRKLKDYASVMGRAVPWHELVCHPPPPPFQRNWSRVEWAAWRFVDDFSVLFARARQALGAWPGEDDHVPVPGVQAPPDYVLKLLAGQGLPELDEDLCGILVVGGRDMPGRKPRETRPWNQREGFRRPQ